VAVRTWVLLDFPLWILRGPTVADLRVARLRSIDEPFEWDAAPGFRTRDLTVDQAYEAMYDAANKMAFEALAARRGLLRLGFAVDHRLCKELDDTARRYNDVLMALRHQRTRAPETTSE
jgi:hypothetical protein